MNLSVYPRKYPSLDLLSSTRTLTSFSTNLLTNSLDRSSASKNKTAFAKPFSSQWLAGNVRIVRGPWNEAYLRTMNAFPANDDAVKDDDVDATSVAYLKLSEALSGLAALEALTRM